MREISRINEDFRPRLIKQQLEQLNVFYAECVHSSGYSNALPICSQAKEKRMNIAFVARGHFNKRGFFLSPGCCWFVCTILTARRALNLRKGGKRNQNRFKPLPRRRTLTQSSRAGQPHHHTQSHYLHFTIFA